MKLTPSERRKKTEELEKEFNRLNRNYLEPGYELSKDNLFHKVVDFNREGGEAFMNYLPKDCYDKPEVE